jgi:peptidoglycan hydrolase-like protein with peptidoglycan-binding domain
MPVTHEFETTLEWPLTRKGDRGHPVGTLQHLLNHHGDHLSVDGAFGSKTETAVRAFQQSRHLDVDGVAGPDTWSAVIVDVGHGSSGDQVRAVQQEAADRDGSGHGLVAIDGEYGHETEAFVRGFQEALAQEFPDDHIAVDGIVGPVTWQALVGGFLLG